MSVPFVATPSSFAKAVAKLPALLLVAVVRRFPCTATFLSPSPSYWPIKRISQTSTSHIYAAPEEALPDIVIPNIFPLSDDVTNLDSDAEDPRVWVPQTDCLSFRPLCLCVSQGYYVNLLKFKGGGMLSRHRHSSPVHALTLKGKWRCK